MIELTGRYANLDRASSEIIHVLDIFQDSRNMRVVYKGSNNLYKICDNVILLAISLNFIFNYNLVLFWIMFLNHEKRKR